MAMASSLIAAGQCTVKKRFKVLGHVISQGPLVAIIPLVALALTLCLGLWGVRNQAKQDADDARALALVEAQSFVRSWQLQITQAIAIASQVAGIIQTRPSLAAALTIWDTFMPAWWPATKPLNGTIILMLPQGTLTRYYPLKGVRPQVLQQMGQNTFGDDRSPFRAGAIAAVRNGVYFNGPMQYAGIYLATVMMSLMLPADSPEVALRWGYNTTCPPGCPQELCYNNATKMLYWGNINLSLNFAEFLDSIHSVEVLGSRGYHWQVLRPGNPFANEPEQVPVMLDQAMPPDAAVAHALNFLEQKWTFYIWRDTWTPSYLLPGMLAVIFGGIFVSVLIFAVLVSRAEHQAVLQSLVPRETLARIRETADWAGKDHELDLIVLETPAQNMLRIIKDGLHGTVTDVAVLLSVQDALHRSADVYRPTAQAMDERMQESAYVDKEVRAALVAQLVGRQASEAKDEDATQHGADHQRTGISEMTTGLSDIWGYTDHALSKIGAAYPEQEQHVDWITATAQDQLRQSYEQPIICIPPQEKLMKVLEGINSWTFDAYELEEASCGHPLSVLAYRLLHTTGLMSWARMDGRQLARFLHHVERGYGDNPYHNKRHAADVLHTLHVMIHKGGLMPGYVDNSTLLACYLAAIVHDFEHKGRTNDFLVSSNDDLAVFYNDRSPMENHHLAAAFAMMKRPELNCFANISTATWHKIRKLVIDLVLATDMKQHFAVKSQFETLHNLTPVKGGATARSSTSNNTSSNNNVTQKAPAHTMVSMEPTPGAADQVSPVSDNDKLLSLQMALKCADLGHLAAPTTVHLRWVTDLEEEMFRQGDAERAAGFPISPLCDRTQGGVTKSQIGFFDFVVLPMYRSFTTRFQATKPLFRAVVKNYIYWEQEAESKKDASVRGGKR